jgi:soluble lytic murein transglycosylase-like protein
VRTPARAMIAVWVAAAFYGLQLNAQGPTPELLYYADAYANHYRVPRALVRAIIEQESNWNPQALSTKDAKGLMQLMPETALEYGVRNPYSIAENLSGGVRYLADLLERFKGEKRLAVAAYYCEARHLEQSGLSYHNRAVVEYVEAVRERYRRELGKHDRDNSQLTRGGQ